MRISHLGVSFIKGFEGYSSTPYQDVAGIWTWGYGHARRLGEDLPASVTREEAEAQLEMDIIPAEKCINQVVKVPINQNQFDALCSFVYNVGGAAFSGSTLLKKINASQMDDAENEFMKWSHAGGKVVQGLLTRRQAEAKLFSTPMEVVA